MEIEVGDWLWFAEAEMECRVTDFDFASLSFTVLTPSGFLLQFYDTDLEHYPAPEDPTREQLERWLRCQHMIVPRLRVEKTTTRCESDCGCRYCYLVETITSRPGQPAVACVTHFVDADSCTCGTERWVRGDGPRVCGCLRQ